MSEVSRRTFSPAFRRLYSAKLLTLIRRNARRIQRSHREFPRSLRLAEVPREVLALATSDRLTTVVNHATPRTPWNLGRKFAAPHAGPIHSYYHQLPGATSRLRVCTSHCNKHVFTLPLHHPVRVVPGERGGNLEQRDATARATRPLSSFPSSSRSFLPLSVRSVFSPVSRN